MPNHSQIFMLLFLMLGPFKILGPFERLTRTADPLLLRKIAFRAIGYSILALILAAVLGESILRKYDIPVPILALSGGIILILVALLNILQQATPAVMNEETARIPSLASAMSPLAFPIIVTPYGIAAVIVFVALSPDLNSKLVVMAMVVGIMVLNLIVMLFARYVYKYLATVLAILGSILSIIQVALGAKIIYNSLKALLAL